MACKAACCLAPAASLASSSCPWRSAITSLSPETANAVLFVTAVTMATIPLLSKLGDRLAPRITPKTSIDPGLLLPDVAALPRVIIAGFGRVGQTVAEMLDVHKVPYVAIDRDPDRVARQRVVRQICVLRRHDPDRAAAACPSGYRPRPGGDAGRYSRGRRTRGRRTCRTRGPADRRARSRRHRTRRISIASGRPTRFRRRSRPACNCPRPCWWMSASRWGR